MLYLKAFTFNPFQENTYILYNDERSAFVIDPGNYTSSENEQLQQFVAEKELRVERLLLTHGHIDHVLGTRFIFDTYGLLPEVHREDVFFLERMTQTAAMYGISCEPSHMPEKFIEEGDEIYLGNYAFTCLHTPGHSPGSISFYNKENQILIGGDVLFRGSIGRSDLPKGNHELLITTIHQKLFALNDSVKVYCGHGPSTTIGLERTSNPLLI